MRPTNWSPLGLDKDPAPGDPEQIRRAARDVSTMATQAQTADTDLTSVVGQVDGSVWSGTSGDQFRATAGQQLAPALGLISDSLSTAATALFTWATAVQDAQHDADQYLAQAVAASADLATASGSMTHIADRIDSAQHDLDAAEPGSAAATAAKQRLTDAQSDQSGTSASAMSAQRRIDDAFIGVSGVIDDYAAAAKKAAAALQKSTDDTKPPPPPPPQKEPGFWQKVGDGTLDVLSTAGNAVLSFGNAMIQHPDETAGMIVGLLTMAGGTAVEGGGLALDATGIGAIGGVPLNIVGGGLIAAGGTATALSAGQLMNHAASDSATSQLDTGRLGRDNATPGTPSENALQRTGNEPNPNYPGRNRLGHYRAEGNNKVDIDHEKEALDKLENDLGVPIERSQVVAKVDGGTPGGRKYDGLIEKPDGTYIGVEIKTNTATRDANQTLNDGLVSDSNPAIAKLNGKTIKITEVHLERYYPE